MDNKVEEVSNLIDEMEEEIKKGITINISEEKNNRYKQWATYLQNQMEVLVKEKYKYVFIGEKGIGKTTTILELFNLINDDKELLSTGSGGTTVCEVEIKKSDKEYSYFDITPIDDRYMVQYIYDFCSTFIRDNDSSNLYVPTEIARSIRNMLGMKKIEIDELYESLNNFEKFIEEVNSRLNLENRNETIIKCKCDKNGLYFSDIENKFNQINLGKVKDIKIPQKITLYITDDVMNFDNEDSILSIIDTRGIESDLSREDKFGKNDSFKREDILNYIDREQDDCIYLFVDGIKPAPTQGILNTLKSRITKKNADKFYLFINIYNDEAEKVITDDGVAGTIESGISFKKDDILFKFKQEKILFNENNLIFYNSKNNIPDNKEILQQIKENLNKQKTKAYEECKNVKSAFEKLKYDFENKDYAIKNFEKLYEVNKQVDAPKDLINKILNEFIDNTMSKVHHMRLDAINRYDGDYYAYNFYYNFSIIIEEVFDEIYINSKSNIIKKVTEFLEYKNITQLDEIDYKIYIEKLEKDYLSERDSLKTYLREYLEKSFSKDSWISAQNEFGTGRGYTERVCKIYTNEISNLNNKNSFTNHFTKRWTKLITENHLEK